MSASSNLKLFMRHMGAGILAPAITPAITLVLVLLAGGVALTHAQTSSGGVVGVEVYGVLASSSGGSVDGGSGGDGEGVWHELTAEVANTPELRQRGLMHRRELPANHGMLFVFPRAEPLSFWMKNTYISLDIMYFASDGSWVNTRAHTPPLSEKSQPSAGAAQYVLEMVAGSGRRLGIGKGSRLVVKNCERLNIGLDSAVCGR